jgi:DNA-binding PadR family transcriptional regulator
MRFGMKERMKHQHRHEGHPSMGLGRRGARGERPFESRHRGPRLFQKQELRLLLLSIIAEKKRHGYELAKAIETMSGGAYAPSPSTVYPTLAMMAAAGIVVGTDDESARRSFAITDAGLAELEQAGAIVDELRQRLHELAEQGEKTDATPVRRAINNLRAVMDAQLGKPGISRETLLETAALIDEAARKIERL